MNEAERQLAEWAVEGSITTLALAKTRLMEAGASPELMALEERAAEALDNLHNALTENDPCTCPQSLRDRGEHAVGCPVSVAMEKAEVSRREIMPSACPVCGEEAGNHAGDCELENA